MVRMQVGNGSGARSAGEQRRGQRVTAPAFAVLMSDEVSEPIAPAFGAVANLSRSGIAVRVPCAFPKGNAVRIRIGIGDQIHEIEARVVRTRKRSNKVYDIALEWTDVTPAAVQLRDSLLRRIAAEKLADRLGNWQVQPQPKGTGLRAKR